MYDAEDFIMLELLNDLEIQEEIRLAKESIEIAQERFRALEEEMYAESPLSVPDMDILFRAVKNAEGYIRKAENLIRVWDSNRYIHNKRINRYKRLNINLVSINNTSVGKKLRKENESEIRKRKTLVKEDIMKRLLI